MKIQWKIVKKHFHFKNVCFLIETHKTIYSISCYRVPALLHQLIRIRVHFTEPVITMRLILWCWNKWVQKWQNILMKICPPISPQRTLRSACSQWISFPSQWWNPPLSRYERMEESSPFGVKKKKTSSTLSICSAIHWSLFPFLTFMGVLSILAV